MNFNENPTAQKLLEAFAKFRRLHMKQIPVQGVTTGELMMMFGIRRETKPGEPGIKVSEISSIMKVAPPSITQMINNLEAAGLVERTMDKSDRRAVRVNLTEQGIDKVLKAKELFHSSLNGLIEYLGEEKSNQLADLLQEVYTYFDLRKDQVLKDN